MTSTSLTSGGLPLSAGMLYLLDHPSSIRQGWGLTNPKARDGLPVPFKVNNHGVGRIPQAACETIRFELSRGVTAWGDRSYTVPAQGTLELRSALADEMCELCEVPGITDPYHVAIVAGGSLGALTFVLGLCTNAEDEWWEIVPAWGGTRHEVNFWGRTHRQFHTHTGHLNEVSDLLRAIPESAKVVSINDPGNPTGQGLTPDDCEKLNAFARRRPNTIVVVDMTYMRLHDGKFVTPFMHGAPNIVCVSGASKAINIPDARLGWVICSPKSGLQEALQRRTNQLLSAPNPYGLQEAIAAGIRDRGPDGVWQYCTRIKAEIDASRDVVGTRLNGHSLITYRRGTSAIYCCLQLDEGIDSRRLWRWGVQQRYEGKIDRPFTDYVSAFYAAARWARFTHSKPSPMVGIENFVLDVEAYDAAGRPKPLSVAELLELYGPTNGHGPGAVT